MRGTGHCRLIPAPLALLVLHLLFLFFIRLVRICFHRFWCFVGRALGRRRARVRNAAAEVWSELDAKSFSYSWLAADRPRWLAGFSTTSPLASCVVTVGLGRIGTRGLQEGRDDAHVIGCVQLVGLGRSTLIGCEAPIEFQSNLPACFIRPRLRMVWLTFLEFSAQSWDNTS